MIIWQTNFTVHIFSIDEEPPRKKASRESPEVSYVDEDHMVIPDPSLAGAQAVCRLIDHAKWVR